MRMWNPFLPMADALHKNHRPSRPLDCTRSLGHALGHSALQVRMASSATATQTEVNEAQSVMLMRNLMRVTFSNVVYTRGIFNSSQFKPMNARDRLS